MKALSLVQPYATGIMLRHKKVETRSWKTGHEGQIAIHASKSIPKWARDFAALEVALGRIPERIPCASIIGLVTIMGMRMTEDIISQIDGLERLYGDYSLGRWAWMLCDPIPFDDPIPCKGHLGLWEVPEYICNIITQKSKKGDQQ
jgi:hypothetical protein